MKARIIILSALFVVAISVEAGRVKLCGTVLMPSGLAFSSGELSLTTTVEKFSGDTPSSTNQTTPLDPTRNRFCIEHDNGTASQSDYFRFRASISKSSAPAQSFYTGNLTMWNAAIGESTSRLVSGNDYDYFIDVIYLGASDPLDRKLFFPGLVPYTVAGIAESGTVVYDSHATLNKIFAATYPDGSRVSDGSFENAETEWEIALPIKRSTAISIKPQHGNQALVLTIPTPFTGHLALSQVFELKPMTSYTLSFYYKSPQVSGGIRPALIALDSKNQVPDDGQILSATTSYSEQGGWTLFTQMFSTPAEASFGRISLIESDPASPGSGVIAFDNVAFVESGHVPPNRISASTAFFDGLNRPFQSMQQIGDTDTYVQTIYDDFGRKIISTLPIGYDYFRQNGRHAFLETLFDGPYGGHLNYYYGAPDPSNPDLSLDPNSPGPKAHGYPFQQIFYEASPLGRVSRTLKAGRAWRGATSNADHDVRNFYGSVTGGLVLATDPDAAPYTADINPSETPDEFFSISKGENGEVSRIFTDLFGRVTRRENKFGSRWITTSEEYDALGNPTHETPPSGPNGQIVSRTMEYNSLRQMLSENSNDIGNHKSIYDRIGRLRFTQSQVQIGHGTFTYFKYDDLDRLVEAGEYEAAASFTPIAADDDEFPGAEDPMRKLHVSNFYDSIPKVLNVCQDQAQGENIFITPPNGPTRDGFFPDLNTAFEVTQSRMATRTSIHSPFLEFFQFTSPSDYEITPLPGSEFTPITLANGNVVGLEFIGVPISSADPTSPFGTPFPFAVNWGPLTGKLTKTTVCNQSLAGTPAGLKEVSSYFNYDKYSNTTHIYEFNGYIGEPAKQWQKILNRFDVQKRLLSREHYETAASTFPIFRFSYSYDALGRVDKVTDQNGDIVIQNSYNMIGQLERMVLGRAGPGRVSLEYSYHFQGWVQEILAKNTAGTQLYHQVLKYEDGVAPRFDGSIAEYNYALVAGATKRYLFGYDPLDRLTQAYTTLTSSPSVDGGTWSYQYADNGAVLRMANLNQAFQYAYVQGNRLDHVVATGIPDATRNFAGVGTFGYDSNGRMTVDNSKQMDVEYDDATDLASSFTRGASAPLSSDYMVYDAGGSRVSKLEYQGSNLVSAKHYASSGKELRYGTQGWEEVYPFEGNGRLVKATNGSWKTEGYIQNYLGSTVKVYNLTDDAESYKTDYEPYGKLRLQTISTGTEITHKFTGKEHDEGIDLDYFGARYYDAGLGVWISPDPARQFHSPYSYAGNGFDPVNGIDPDGKEITGKFVLSTGTFTVTDVQTKASVTINNVFSGNSQANNPAASYMKNVGPLPTGKYLLGQGYFSGHNPNGNDTWYKLYGKNGKGGYSYNEVPVKDPNGNTVVRGGFNLHTGRASDGCITVWSDVPPGSPNYPQSADFEDAQAIIDNTKPMEYNGSSFSGTIEVEP